MSMRILLAVAGLFGLGILGLRFWPAEPVMVAPPEPVAQAMQDRHGRQTTEWSSQPLFFTASPTAGRTAVAIDVEAAGREPAPRLEGVVIDDGLPWAILALETGERRLSGLGETVAGWTVTAIEDRTVLLVRDGERVERRLYIEDR